MANLPLPTKHAKVGSNVKARKRLAAANESLLEQRVKPLRLAERAFLRQRGDILTKPMVRNAAEIFRRHRDAYNQAFVKANGNGDAIQSARQRTRAEIDRALRASIPRFAKYEALRDRHAQDTGALVATHLISPQGGLDFRAGSLVLPGGGLQQFVPPFELFDVSPPPSPQDRSFADPRLGVVVTNEQFHTEHDSILGVDPLGMGFNPKRSGEHRSSVGVNFRVPSPGFVTGRAEIKNLFAKFVISAVDNFGFSHAFIHVDHSVFVIIIRSGEITRFEETVYANGIVARGDDLSRTFAPILDSTPFTVTFTTQDSFLRAEQIQVLVGAASFFRIDLDDMSAFVSTLTGWQVKRLSIGMRL